MHVCAPRAYLVLTKTEEVTKPLELILQITELLCGCWKLNPGPLEEQSVLNWLSHFSSPYQGLFSIKSFANKANWIFHFLKSYNHLISFSCFLDKNFSGELVRMERFVLLLILGKMLLFFPILCIIGYTFVMLCVSEIYHKHVGFIPEI